MKKLDPYLPRYRRTFGFTLISNSRTVCFLAEFGAQSGVRRV